MHDKQPADPNFTKMRPADPVVHELVHKLNAEHCCRCRPRKKCVVVTMGDDDGERCDGAVELRLGGSGRA